MLSDGIKGRRWLLIRFCLFAALLFFLLPYKMYLWLWLLVVIFIQISGTALTTLSDSTATDVATSYGNAPSVMGAHSFAIDLGSALGPLLGYVLSKNFSLRTPFFLSGFCLILVAFIWSRIKYTLVR
jgi:predicted MFS family arabinose efflux permease